MRKPPISTPDGSAALASRTRSAWRDARIDALIDSYVEWREECETVEAAYERWADSERASRALAYAAYGAALDREETAAGAYRLAAVRLVGVAREQRRA